jgi:quinoprotein glucose dehydrogenase
MTLDEKRGIVYVPTGSAAFDFWGGDRKGQNLFANCLLALDAATGKRIWHYQVVHHDLWDRDLPAPPNLFKMRHNGRSIDAVAQITKSGFIFVFDRETGEPLFEIEERNVPESDLEGEETWPTQPFPLQPPPFSPQSFTENEVTRTSVGLRMGMLKIYLQLQEQALSSFPLICRGLLSFPDSMAEASGRRCCRSAHGHHVH